MRYAVMSRPCTDWPITRVSVTNGSSAVVVVVDVDVVTAVVDVDDEVVDVLDDDVETTDDSPGAVVVGAVVVD